MSQAQVEHRNPRELLDELAAIEVEIAEEVEALRLRGERFGSLRFLFPLSPNNAASSISCPAPRASSACAARPRRRPPN
jgi:hypothetical protein